MTLSYLDTSAAMKLVVDEPESDPLVTALSTGRRLGVDSVRLRQRWNKKRPVVKP